MKSIFKIKLLAILLLFTFSCSDNRTLEDKLEGLTPATRADLVRLGELELNSISVPVYNQEGKRLNDREMLKTLESKQYRLDYYLDEDDRLGAVVVRPIAEDENTTNDI